MGVVCISPGSGGVDSGCTGSGGGTLGLVAMGFPSLELWVWVEHAGRTVIPIQSANAMFGEGRIKAARGLSGGAISKPAKHQRHIVADHGCGGRHAGEDGKRERETGHARRAKPCGSTRAGVRLSGWIGFEVRVHGGTRFCCGVLMNKRVSSSGCFG